MWLVPPQPVIPAAPPVTGDEPISSSGALDVAVDDARTNGASGGTREPGGRQGNAFFHACRSGDTITSVARACGVDAQATAKLNGWSATHAPAQGTMLLLPRNMDNVATAPDVTSYKVASGDTFTRIASRFKVSVPALKALNKAKTDSLNIGDVLYVPNAH